MSKFFTRHPFYKQLIKLAAAIVVGWNAFILASMGPLLFLVIIGLALGAGNSSSPTADSTFKTIYGTGTNELLSIKVGGTIIGATDDQTSPLGALSSNSTAGYDIKKKLYTAADNTHVKGIVLEINSPGGTIYGAHAIADGVKYYRDKTHHPVYTYVEGMAASGAYWAAASTDRIIADYGSDIGSIGVIMGPFKYYDKPVSETSGLLDGGIVTQNGIQSINITAGKSKDLGNPYRRLTADEITELQQQVNNDYDVFVGYVAERRHIPEATLRNQIGAMAYDNKTALTYKLTDATGSREDAYDQLATAAHVAGDYYVSREEAPSSFVSSILGAITHQPQRQVSATNLCALTHGRLAYAGDVSALCSAAQ